MVSEALYLEATKEPIDHPGLYLTQLANSI